MRSTFEGEFEMVGVDLWPVAVWWIDWSRISRSQVSVWSEGCSESELFGVGSVRVEGGRSVSVLEINEGAWSEGG